MTLPSTHQALNTYIQVAVPYLNANAARLAITAVNSAAITTKKTAWDLLWAKYIDPAQVNSQIRQNLNELITDWKQLLTSVYNDFPGSVLTSTDGSTLNISLSTTRTHVAVADHAPVLQIETLKHLQVTLRITDPDFPATKAMPAGQHVHLHIGIQDTPASPIVWDILRLMEVHKFLADVIFTDADVSKKAYLRAYYINTRGEKGPLSDSISTTIA